MNILWLAFEGAWHVLLAGLLLGAGLPAIFALGIRALSIGSASAGTGHRPCLPGKVLASLCFALVFAAILLGIGTIVAHGLGAHLSFDGFIPVFVAR